MENKEKLHSIKVRELSSQWISTIIVDNEYKLTLEAKHYNKIYQDSETKLGKIDFELLQTMASGYRLPIGSDERGKVDSDVQHLERTQSELLLQKDASKIVIAFINKKAKEIDAEKKFLSCKKVLIEFGITDHDQLRIALELAHQKQNNN